jgi:hypothetical protein
VNWNTTISRSDFERLKKVIKEDNTTNLLYFNLLGMVILRPVLVILGGGASDDSPP